VFSGEGNRQEERAVRDGFHIVGDIGFERQQLTGDQIRGSFGCLEPDSPLDSVY